jgi:hypothetical protein
MRRFGAKFVALATNRVKNKQKVKRPFSIGIVSALIQFGSQTKTLVSLVHIELAVDLANDW